MPNQQHTSPSTQPSGPIFIVGAPRSGTTMLQFRLRNHPRISFPTGESHFIIPICLRADAFGDLTKLSNVRGALDAMYRRNKGFFEEELHGMKLNIDSLSEELHAEGRDSIPRLISGLFEKNAQGEGKARWGDKTPYYVMHITKLLEWFPDAQIVHLIRDGRDVALSLFARRHDFQTYNAAFAAEYWESYVERGQKLGKTLSSNQYFELRYEDLLSNPDASMRRLCEYLGESYSEELFTTTATDTPGQTPLVHQPIKAENSGKWRTQMTPWQIRVFTSVAGKTLEKNGYELTASKKPPSIPFKVAYRMHNRLHAVLHQLKSGK